MVKTGTLFEHGPVYLAPTRHYSHGRPSLFFTALLFPCIILNANQRTKNGGGLGMRLVLVYVAALIPSAYKRYLSYGQPSLYKHHLSYGQPPLYKHHLSYGQPPHVGAMCSCVPVAMGDCYFSVQCKKPSPYHPQRLSLF